MMKKQTIWCNGIGVEPKLWFKSPRRMHRVERHGFNDYVPVGDKKSSWKNGGCWVEPGRFDCIRTVGDCIVYMSPQKEKVELFTRVVKEVAMRSGRISIEPPGAYHMKNKKYSPEINADRTAKNLRYLMKNYKNLRYLMKNYKKYLKG